MDLRSCDDLHYMQAINGGLVTKVPNVSYGQPKISFKVLAGVIEGRSNNNDDVKAVRSCIDVMEEAKVKTEPDVWVGDTDDSDAQRIHTLDDDDFPILTLKQIQKSCKARKRKRSPGNDYSKIKNEEPSTLEDHVEKQKKEEDDPDFTETLSSLITKLSKNKKTRKKKKCVKDHPMSSQEIVLVDKSEEILDGPEFSASSGDSAALVEVKLGCPENDCFDRPDDCSGRESKDAEITLEWNLESEKNNKWIEFFDHPPLRMVEPSSMDIVMVNSQLSSNQSTNFLAIEFEDHNNSDIHDNQLDNDTDIPVSPPKVASHEDIDYACLEFRDDDTPLIDCSKDESTAVSEEHDKLCSTIEHGLNPDGYLVCRTDNSPECESTAVSEEQDKHCSTIEHGLNPDGYLVYRTDNSPECESTAVSDEQAKPCSTIEHGLNPDGYLVCRTDNSPECESTAVSEEHDKTCFTIEPGLNPYEYLVCHSDDSPEYVEKQSFDSVCDDDIGTPVSPPKVASHKDLDSAGLEFGDDNTLIDDCRKDDTAGAEVQDKLCSTFEPGLNPDECVVGRPDDLPENKEKQSFVSLYDGEKIHINEATDELTSWNEHDASPKLHGPERLLSTRKAISPSSQEKLCKAMGSIVINHKNSPKCKGEIQFTEQTDKNGDAERLNDITRFTTTEVTNNPDKIKVVPKTSKSGSRLKSVSKIRNPSHSAGCSTLQDCSKTAIEFSKQQMKDAESISVRLTKELKAMRDIMDDMLRSEFCLNTSLRYKVNEATMAVKNATKAEEIAKKSLSFMSRDCSRFCKIMTLAGSSSSTPQDVVSPPQNVVRREKKIAFADEAGGKLCQVRYYEDDEGHLPKSK